MSKTRGSEQELAMFEAHCQRHIGCDLEYEDDEHGYKNYETNLLWAGWQARAALSAQPQKYVSCENGYPRRKGEIVGASPNPQQITGSTVTITTEQMQADLDAGRATHTANPQQEKADE